MPTRVKDPTTWLTNEFFEKALRHATYDKSLVVKDFFINLHANASGHYASTVYRANVSCCTKGKTESVALVIKLISSKVNQSADGLSFENEFSMYKNLVTPMQSLLKQAGVENAQLAPKLIYASTEPQPVIILEDAQHTSYELHKDLMNLENSKFMAAKLAKFHAASYCLLNNSANKDFENVSGGLFLQKSSDGVKFMEENFVIFTEEISKWSGFESYAEKFEKLSPSFASRSAEVYNQDKVNLKVLNHGDFHYNNMLIKFDSDKKNVMDVLLIDFQLSSFGSAAVDLYYLLYLVCDRETRDNHREQLIHHYHQQFVKTLDQLGHMGKAPSLVDINEDLLKCGFLEVVIVVCFLPFLYADYGTALNVYDDCQDAKQYRRQLFNNPKCREIIEPLLPYFMHKGFLN